MALLGHADKLGRVHIDALAGVAALPSLLMLAAHAIRHSLVSDHVDAGLSFVSGALFHAPPMTFRALPMPSMTFYDPP